MHSPALQDNGSEHPHRVALTVRAGVTQAVVQRIQESVRDAGLQV